VALRFVTARPAGAYQWCKYAPYALIPGLYALLPEVAVWIRCEETSPSTRRHAAVIRQKRSGYVCRC
jgi:hypothetical protein